MNLFNLCCEEMSIYILASQSYKLNPIVIPEKQECNVRLPNPQPSLKLTVTLSNLTIVKCIWHLVRNLLAASLPLHIIQIEDKKSQFRFQVYLYMRFSETGRDPPKPPMCDEKSRRKKDKWRKDFYRCIVKSSYLAR